MECCFHTLIADCSEKITPEMINSQSEFHSMCESKANEFISTIISTLERENSSDGVFGVLQPAQQRKVTFPRGYPLFIAKEKTKWQKFAKEKGIRKNKKQLVYDPVDHSYKLPWGGRSIKKDQEKRDIIYVHKPNTDYMINPFEEKKVEKLLVKKKQELKTMSNILRNSGNMPNHPSASIKNKVQKKRRRK